jgi:hypothetical protein
MRRHKECYRTFAPEPNHAATSGSNPTPPTRPSKSPDRAPPSPSTTGSRRRRALTTPGPPDATRGDLAEADHLHAARVTCAACRATVGLLYYNGASCLVDLPKRITATSPITLHRCPRAYPPPAPSPLRRPPSPAQADSRRSRGTVAGGSSPSV